MLQHLCFDRLSMPCLGFTGQVLVCTVLHPAGLDVSAGWASWSATSLGRRPCRALWLEFGEGRERGGRQGGGGATLGMAGVWQRLLCSYCYSNLCLVYR